MKNLLNQLFIFLIVVLASVITTLKINSLNSDLNGETKIDSLQLIIDSLRVNQDTIVIKIIEHDTLLKHVKEQYKKDSAIIVNQSAIDDVEFFQNFISDYAK